MYTYTQTSKVRVNYVIRKPSGEMQLISLSDEVDIMAPDVFDPYVTMWQLDKLLAQGIVFFLLCGWILNILGGRNNASELYHVKMHTYIIEPNNKVCDVLRIPRFVRVWRMYFPQLLLLPVGLDL